ncbi:CHAT domain-containing tetratricopeptide repeat protein [Flavobacterium sp.]|uniref:CHAT domain-containing protein n=1 Tax=Flavobacterium sp. TaxID=239 RepID=UPI002C2DF5ED|nr:CHAT domain-containing tetratricopeptide repeat protein [Flavobacterium sp.]HSD07659.1 CHAT domain-containing tetratricopeptide repeat protein [Flavobacterium sp.]
MKTNKVLNNKKNKIRVFVYFMLILFVSSLHGQSKIDSISFYSEKGNTKKAISFAEELKYKHIKEKDTLNINYANLLTLLGKLNKSIKDIKKSEKYYIQAINVLKKHNESNELTKATFLDNLAVFYKDQGQFANAYPLFQRVHDIREKHLRKDDTDYIHSLFNLAFTAQNLGYFEKAKSLYFKGLELQRNFFGDTHYEVANTLSSIGEICYHETKYTLAEKYFTQSRQIYISLLGENDRTSIKASNNLAECLHRMGNYGRAKSILTDVLKRKKIIYDQNDSEFVVSINNLASVHQDLGEYEYAEKLYKKALENIGKNPTNNSKNYSVAINNLAILYHAQNKNKEAEDLYIRSIAFSKKYFGEYSRDYATSIDNLASFYQDILIFDKAEKFYLQALKIRKSVVGENHPDYLVSLQNISSLYLNIGLYDKAEQNALISKKLFENIYSKEHPEYSSVLNNLANIYLKKGNYFQAEKLYLESENIVSKTFESTHPYHISSLFNLATVKFYQKRYIEAKGYYIKIIALSKNNYDYGAIQMLAIIEDLLSNQKLASNYYNKLSIGFRDKINDSFSYLSSDELNPIVKNYFSNRFYSLSFLQRNQNKYENMNIGCYENELLVKNISLRNQQNIIKSIQKSTDTALKKKYEQFVNNKRLLNKLNELPIEKRPAQYEQLTADTKTLEKELLRQSTVFVHVKNTLSVDWKKVQEKLKPNEVAIELVSYNYYDKKWTGNLVYAAFVVKKGYIAPKYIPLFEQKQLELLLAKSKNEKDNIQIDRQYSDKAISDLFLKPVQNELKGIKSIYLSPTGLGNQINFSALPVTETQTLGEKYQVHILGSTAEIVNYKVSSFDKKSKLKLFLYGNIDYDKSEVSNKVVSDTVTNSSPKFTALASRTATTTKFEYLGGSKIEINKINADAKQNNFESAIIEDKKATEESIKLLDGRTIPFVLHLATHGFFYSHSKQELLKEDLSSGSKSTIYKTADDPMMRSGLVFAGANKYWDKPTENIATDDGVLTANDISNMDFNACQLVVLSACKTGLGEIQGSEGVFGLQRAFKMAGVKNIIMSLWKVPDAQTAELFDIFYSECFAGKTIHEAFQIAQSKMKSKYSPYYWAGFVLLE